MNLIFWLIVATMIAIALLIVILPIIRTHRPLPPDDTRQRNIQIARDRLAELKANKTAGGISQTQYDEQVAELELALNDDLSSNDSVKPVTSQGRWLAYVLLIAIPVLSVLLYIQLGDYQAINRINEPQPADNAALPSKEQINQMVAKLAAKLQSEPNNLEGWVMLGRSYKVLERYQESAEAFGHAYQLANNKPDIVLPYAEALALSNKGNWAGKPIELINQVLSNEPQNLAALWYAAIANAQQGDNRKAIDYLLKLETMLPEGSEDKKQIQAIIAETKKNSGNNTRTPPAQSTHDADISISIEVSIAAELQNKVQKDDTVFIYAQALSGPKMPLAIVKKQVADLPAKINLSDGNGMMPEMKLSQFKQVKLVARISKSGSAMPQSGDIIGEIGQVNPANQTSHQLIINHRLE
ncbi:hypothetical protein MCAMS1_02026 [biofilm metagenome]